jgi:hypothetical protein
LLGGTQFGKVFRALLVAVPGAPINGPA